MRRVGLPPGGSTLITSAPSPARVSPHYSACASASSTTRMPVRGARAARDEVSTTLLLQLDRDSGARERELHALRRRGQGHLHAVLVLHRRHRGTASDRPA